MSRDWALFRPAVGWAGWLMGYVVLWFVASAVLAAQWVPELTNLHNFVFVSYTLTSFFAMAKIRRFRAWLSLCLIGFLYMVLRLADAVPKLSDLRDLGRYREIAGANWGAFVTRLATWIDAIQAGSPSEETLPFAVFMSALLWVGASYLAWMVLRHKRPFSPLLALSIGMGFNAYLGAVPSWLIFFYALAALRLLASVQSGLLLDRWQRTGVNFDIDIRLRMQFTSWVLTFSLLIIAYLFADVRSIRVARAFAQSPPIASVEAWLDRSFAGVNSKRLAAIGIPTDAKGVLPRDYLLGDAPALYETVMMTAQLELDSVQQPLRPTHWRVVAYDVYTGRGWTRSEEAERRVEANQPLINQPTNTTQVRQAIDWRFDDRFVRYSFGEPYAFDHELFQSLGFALAPVWGRGDSTRYEATSVVSHATNDQLNQVRLEDIDPEFLAHYTQLSDELPVRVSELAQSIVSPEMTPFQQTAAIEQFVKQYTYSLNISAPPRGRDVVDYFLFDEQAGYCDSFATSMVVLARSVGLPARLAAGFASTTPDEDGVQTIHQIDGHSWAEVYFGEYGWIEFEPTAGFSAVVQQADNPTFDNAFQSAADASAPTSAGDGPNFGGSPDIPETVVEDGGNRPFLILFSLIALTLAAIYLWGKQKQSLAQQYALLQKHAPRVGVKRPINQTPLEFRDAWHTHFDTLPKSARWRFPLIDLNDHAAAVTSRYSEVSYGEKKGEEGVKEKRPMRLWLLLLHWLKRR